MPVQIVPLPVALAEKPETELFTNTFILTVGLPQALLAVTVYVPLLAAVEFATEVFCVDAEKLFGPLQLHVVTFVPLAFKLIVAPAQTVSLGEADAARF